MDYWDSKITKHVEEMLIDYKTGDFLIKNDPVFGDYNPKCCYQNRNCNLKCCKCIVNVETIPYETVDEFNNILTTEVQNFLIDTCGVMFKTRIDKE